MAYDQWRPLAPTSNIFNKSHWADNSNASPVQIPSPWDVPKTAAKPTTSNSGAPVFYSTSQQASSSSGPPSLRVPRFAQRKLDANNQLVSGAPPPLRMPNLKRSTPIILPTQPKILPTDPVPISSTPPKTKFHLAPPMLEPVQISPQPSFVAGVGLADPWYLGSKGSTHQPILVEPNPICSKQYLQEIKVEGNPWLPPKIEGAGQITVAGITPLGGLKKLPTSDIRPIRTPRRMPRPEDVPDNTPDPIISIPIYLDLTPTSDQAYNHVAEHMRSIAETTKQLRGDIKTELKPVLAVKGRVSAKVFDQALEIYENNQLYYQDRIEAGDLDPTEIGRGLTELEFWFVQIIEPKPRGDVEAWKIRERNKVKLGISGYCDEELAKYIQPLPAAIRAFIVGQQARLLN